MKWTKTTKEGYTHDARIYLIGFFTMLLIFFLIAYSHDFDTMPSVYAECQQTECLNPYYKTECRQQLRILFFVPLYTTKDCTTLPENAWILQETLKRGTYGTPPDPWLKNSWWIMTSILLLSFTLNHYIYNRGKPFDIELTISKKRRYSLGWTKINSAFKKETEK